MIKRRLFTIILFFTFYFSSPASLAENKVSVIHNGYVSPIKGFEFLPGARDDGRRKIASTVTLVEGENTLLIADPGMAAKGVWPTLLKELATRGYSPEQVTHVLISHHHPDHNTQLGLFPNAVIVDHWATYQHDL
ncbi:hypothetical protein CJF42_12255 [Pseudoalteromonas sp. NBT06-2]|uniref:MBL fold metallo-hydrolase n=1 Tax=Pseudoalteromonas sp. NBT06-2 TaxID=2025950 RepID=UPI000BA76B57|nr:MBL fold metallo-hydrolase [Pseudoalteromonas sp. NBT06-2]PAJ74081.1 hypothetical protein CJF42_12255 [Pseudoalteromonas sp. NBT06-2]